MEEKNTAGLYVHIPFCIQKCRYCSFCSVAVRGAHDARLARYMHCLYAEMDEKRPQWEGVRFDSLFIGGGTPSVLPMPHIPRLIHRIHDAFSMGADAEITVEVNPESFTPQKAYRFAEAGVNRLSVGVQSTDERELKLLGRPHTWEDAQNALDYARMAGLDNISVDLMYNLPNQKVEDFVDSIRRVLDLGIPHLSCYALSLEEGTPLHEAVRRGELPTPGDDMAADMWEAVGEIAHSFGLGRYEISNYAKPGSQSRHNRHYWNQDGYLGLGAAAHSARVYQDHVVRMSNTDDLETYLEKGPVQHAQQIRGQNMMFEYVMLQTRLCDGLDLQDFQARFHVPFERVYQRAIHRAVQSGLAIRTQDRFFLTDRGLLVQNAVLQWFMPADRASTDGNG